MTELSLPEGFVFGVATSAYEVEGAASVGDRGPSFWDTFTQWTAAYSARSALVHVDTNETFDRTHKKSVHWVRQLARTWHLKVVA